MEPYIPDSLPLKIIDWEMHVSLIGKANAALARYDGILLGIVNPQVLLSPLTTREAVLSSRIEGTQASLEDVLQYEADVESRLKRETGSIL
jgi:Fic family protein